MTQTSLQLVAQRKPAKCAVTKGYVLHLPDGTNLPFASLPELIVGLNKRDISTNKLLLADLANTLEVSTQGGFCYPVRHSEFEHVARNYLYIRLDEADGSTKDIIDGMVRDVANFAIDANGVPLQVWQMRTTQWAAIEMVVHIARRGVPVLSDWHRYQKIKTADDRLLGPEDYAIAALVARIGMSNHGPKLPDGSFNSRHDVHVGFALVLNKPVPQAVLDDYADPQTWPYFDMRWFGEVLTKPFLRGCMHHEKLSTLLRMIKSPESTVQELTELTLPRFLDLMGTIPDDASLNTVDDALYKGGILKLREQKLPAAETLGTAFNAFATEIYKQQIAVQTLEWRGQLQHDVAARSMTLREQAMRERDIESLPCMVGFKWANRLAQAFDSRDIDQLLEMLDCAEGTNNASKRAVEAKFGVKLLNVKAVARRRAIYTAAGFVSDEEYLAADKGHKERKADAVAAEKQAEAQRREDANLKNLKAQAFKFRDKFVNGVEFIDTIWAEGYTQLRAEKRGACPTFFLEGPGRGCYSVKGASLQYARSLVAKAAMLSPA